MICLKLSLVHSILLLVTYPTNAYTTSGPPEPKELTEKHIAGRPAWVSQLSLSLAWLRLSLLRLRP